MARVLSVGERQRDLDKYPTLAGRLLRRHLTPTVLLPVCGLQASAHGSEYCVAQVLHLEGTWVWMGEFAF